MATVHRALERGMDGFERIVALKRLLPHLAADASFIKSFVREAKLASLLSHANIVHIFELGRVATQYFISMEYIDGRDIRRILRHARKVTGPPPIHVTVGLLTQLCDALDHAHGKTDDDGHALGLVHRDVSPSNVLVTTAGQVKVIDFGIARAQSSQLRTQTGRVKGKLAYMAPEALSGKDLDARSDLFAAGVIAHELLTARPLFASKNEYQTLMKVQRGEVMPPSTFNQHCPPELDAIVLRTLAKEPDDRFASASELRDELHAMRRHYGLASAEPDIAAWVDWAFRLEAPAGGASGRTFDPPRAAAGTRPKPRAKPRREDDEAVELAWGGNEDGDGGEPVVLEDVPDVSEKHLASSAGALGAEVRLDLDDLADDLADDIPTPSPSHGRADDSASRATVLMIPRSARARQPSQLIPVHVPQVARPAAGPDAPAPSAAITAGVRSVMIPPRVRTITIPPRLMPTASIAPRGAPASEAANEAANEAPNEAPRTVPASSAPLPVVGRARRPTSPGTGRSGSGVYAAVPEPVHRDTLLSPAFAHGPPQRDTLTTERTPQFSLEDLGLAADTLPAMPALQSSEPIVRFREPTIPPMPPEPPEVTVVDRAAEPARIADRPPERPTIPSAQLTGEDDLGLMPVDPTTEPMADPPAGSLAEVLHNPLRQLKGGRARLITPATALFAEPEPDTDVPVHRSVAASGHALQRTSNRPLPGPAPHPAGRRRWLALAVVVLGAAGGAAAYYLTRHHAPPVEPRPPTPPPAHTSPLGTIHFETVPTDAAITITGLPAHAGSPWDAELARGVHQVEIHHDGFKAWLTSIDVAAGERQDVRVALAPLGSAVMADATLVIASNPAGLDAVLDGNVVGKTPARLSVKPGMHRVALRRGAAELWQKGLDAGAGTTYELHPQLAGEPAAVSAIAPAALAVEVEPAKPEEAPAAPSGPIAQVTPIPAPAPPPAPAPILVGPVSVAPSAVTKLSGPTPNISELGHAELPAKISAKLCIDAAGAVTSAELLTVVASAPAAQILGALHQWRYAPYQLDGAPHAACFAVAFRVNTP